MRSHFFDHRFLNIPFSALAVSLSVHLGIVLLVAVSPVLESLGLSLFPRKKTMDELYQSFIQVDVVALPDYLPNEKMSIDTALPVVDKPAEETKPEEKTEGKKDDLMVFEEAKKVEDAKKAAEEKKKRVAEEEAKQKAAEKKKVVEQEKAMKKLQEEAKREAALKALQGNKSGKAGRGKLAGNVLSKGTSLTGAVGNAKDQYAGRVLEAIRQNFNIYFWQQKKGLAATIHLDLYPTGKIRSRQIVKRSSDSTYDSAVLQAIDAASFPPPEDPSIVEEGFNITFIP